MNIVLLQGKVESWELDQLLREFPNFLFLPYSEATYQNLSSDEWNRVEVLFGNRLSEEDLELAPKLRWIHTTSNSLTTLCTPQIEELDSIIVTTTHEQNSYQVGEFTIAAILAFSKNLYHWSKSTENPATLWDASQRNTMWTLKGKTLLIAGINDESLEIARRAKEFGIKTIGLSSRLSFQPHIDRLFSLDKLPDQLPGADIVCINLPEKSEYTHLLNTETLPLFKQDSILITLQSNTLIEPEALAPHAEKFRGILLDASYQRQIPASSPLWQVPGIIISPDVAPRPKSKEHLSFKIFRYNLRQYIHGNFRDMRNIVPFTADALSTSV